jgi:hypothetical protein
LKDDTYRRMALLYDMMELPAWRMYEADLERDRQDLATAALHGETQEERDQARWKHEYLESHLEHLKQIRESFQAEFGRRGGDGGRGGADTAPPTLQGDNRAVTDIFE